MNFSEILLNTDQNIVSNSISIIEKLPNGSDQAVIACYLGLYEDGEVEHINGV